jgi:predicted nucleotidyltransferase
LKNRNKFMLSVNTTFDSSTSADLRLGKIFPEVINVVCTQIVRHYYPDKIFLFGSQAQGTGKEDSDLDLLIIIDNTNPLAVLKRRDRYSQILRLFQHKKFGLDAIVLTNQEVQKLIAENEGEWDLIGEIINNGKILYERKNQN